MTLKVEYWERTCRTCDHRAVIHFPNPARGAAWRCSHCHRYDYLNAHGEADDYFRNGGSW